MTRASASTVAIEEPACVKGVAWFWRQLKGQPFEVP
jgi:hypothetical protein